ncbi:protein FAR1-RELATED SEQUENCE [Citrus sinensis]|uniref:Protein FAR1-RELATED SEQUENCE n=1 Tax=Citrus sinensis TaxID=2711 RepID=A0ACB8L600_CITSI|nr:protein FAR1-RELATED SEQUENCE [Citrus sinensis]
MASQKPNPLIFLRLQPNQKIGCNAKIGGRLDFVCGKWVIGNLIFEHNHAVSPSKSRYYRCNRTISPFVKKQLEINEEVGIKMAQSFKSIVVEASGFENVSFLERDARNHVDKVRRLRLGEGDAVAIQRAAYKDFGDVVTFDTTYLTNKYDMPFAPFVGINHHGQSILLGCGLISHEDTETFTWLFETWLSSFVKTTFWAGMSTTQRSESMNAFFDGYVNSKTTLKQFVEKYEKAMESKIEKEWQADARSFSQRLPCRTSFAIEKQVEEVYTISEFQEFQQELVNKIYCEVFSCGGSEYEVIENDEKSREKTFRVIFEKDEGEIRCVCSMFEYKGILCKHAIVVLSRNRVQLLPEKYIVRRWRKDVRRFSSKVKVSYNARSSSIEHQRYKEECTTFYDVAEVASKNEESHKNIMGWIEKVMKDVSLNVRCDGDDTTIDSGSSSNIQDPMDAEIHDLSSQVATTIPTKQSKMAMQPQQAPLQNAFFPPYYQYWMNYGQAHHVHLQHAPQQNFEEANQGEFSTNEPSM